VVPSRILLLALLALLALMPPLPLLPLLLLLLLLLILSLVRFSHFAAAASTAAAGAASAAANQPAPPGEQHSAACPFDASATRTGHHHGRGCALEAHCFEHEQLGQEVGQRHHKRQQRGAWGGIEVRCVRHSVAQPSKHPKSPTCNKHQQCDAY
jgi:hypothetical protein